MTPDPVAFVTILTALVVSVAFWVIAGRAGRRVETADQYYSGVGEIGSKQYSETYLATNVTFTAVMLLLVEVGYQYGWWALWAPVAWALGMYVARRVFTRHILASFDKKPPKTLPEFIGQKFQSPGLRRTIAVISVIAFIGTVATEGIGLVYAFSAFGVISRLYAPLALLAIMLLLIRYSQRSGFPGVLATERLQLVLLGVSYVAIIISAIVAFGEGPQEIVDATSIATSDGLLAAIGFLILFVPFHLCVVDMWQRCYAANWKPPVLKNMASGKTVVAFSLALGIPVLVGVFARLLGFGTSDRSYLLFDLIRLTLDSVGPLVGGVLAATMIGGFVAGAFSTADTLLVGSGSIFVYDYRRDRLDEPRSLIKVREAVVVIGFAAVLLIGPEFIFSTFSLVDLAYAVFSNQVAFAPIVLLALFISRERIGRTGILVGFLITSFLACIGVVVMGAVLDDPAMTSAAPIVGVGVAALGIPAYLLDKRIRGSLPS